MNIEKLFTDAHPERAAALKAIDKLSRRVLKALKDEPWGDKVAARARGDFSDARRLAREVPLDKMALVERRIASIARRYLGELPGMTWTSLRPYGFEVASELIANGQCVAIVVRMSDEWTWRVWAPGEPTTVDAGVSGDACSQRAACAAVASVLSTNEWDDVYVPPTA